MDRVKAAAALACLFGMACGGGGHKPPAAAASASTAGTDGQNHPPVIASVTLDPSDPRPGQQVTARVEASDPEGDPITFDYRWTVGGSPVESANGMPSMHVEGNDTGSAIEVTVIARDAHGQSEPKTAYTRLGNLPPTIVQVVMKPLGMVTAGNDVTASPIARDPEGDPIEYRYLWRVNHETAPVNGPTLPASMFKRGDEIVLEVVANDGHSDSEPIVSAPIEVVNAAPKIVSTPGVIGDDGKFRYEVKAEDPDGDRLLRYRLTKAPAGMTIGLDDGVIQWVPPADAAASNDIEVEVEDRYGASSKQDFALKVEFTHEQTAGDQPVKRDWRRRDPAPAKAPTPASAEADNS